MSRILVWFGKHRVYGPKAVILVIIATMASVALRLKVSVLSGVQPGFEIFGLAFVFLPLITTRRYWFLAHVFAMIYGWNWILITEMPLAYRLMESAFVLAASLLISEVVDTLRTTIQDVNKARARSELLQDELNHRIQNVLAVVLILIGSTEQQKHKTPERALHLLHDRVTALSLAHYSLQIGESYAEFEMRNFLTSLLSPYLTTQARLPDNIRLYGPSVRCSGSILVSLGLAIHELATNAAKHGALSRRDGLLYVHWTVTASKGEKTQTARLSWREFIPGGLDETPCDQDAERFGLGLLDASAKQLDGTFDYSFARTGFQAVLQFPLPNITPASA